MGVDCAVIYGSLPPGAKLGMAAKFNDPDDPCKVLVATDAVGMGLNLNIRRLVFYSMTKLQVRRQSGFLLSTICFISIAVDGVGREDDGRDFGIPGTADRRSGRPVRHQVGDGTRDYIQAGRNQGDFAFLQSNLS